jgi:hypothetical protein
MSRWKSKSCMPDDAAMQELCRKFTAKHGKQRKPEDKGRWTFFFLCFSSLEEIFPQAAMELSDVLEPDLGYHIHEGRARSSIKTITRGRHIASRDHGRDKRRRADCIVQASNLFLEIRMWMRAVGIPSINAKEPKRGEECATSIVCSQS